MTSNNHDAHLSWRLASGPEIDMDKAESLKDAFITAWNLALGCKPDQLEQELRCSRATIYRNLQLAKAERLLEDHPRVALPRGPGARLLMAAVLETELGKEVRAAYPEDVAPFEVLVTSNAALPPVRRRPGDLELVHFDERRVEATRRVGAAAARRLMLALLTGIRVIGINWGFHCYRLSQALPGGLAERLPRDEAEHVEFFPLVGSLGVTGPEARTNMISETSANANATRCVDNLNQYGVLPDRRLMLDESGRELPPAVPPPVQLTQPCVIPAASADSGGAAGDSRTEEERLRAIWRYLALDRSIQTVFGRAWAARRIGDQVPPGSAEQAPALLERADCLITGISASEISRAWRIGAIDTELLAKARAANAVAEISAHYICHKRDYPACCNRLRDVNLRVVAPTLEDYIACTERARLRGRGLGTMLLSSGAHKAVAVDAAISHGAVNILVCDEELAYELLALRSRG